MDEVMAICLICGTPIIGRGKTDASFDEDVFEWDIDAVLLEGPLWPEYRREPRIMEAQHVPDEAVKQQVLLTFLLREDVDMPLASIDAEVERIFTYLPKFEFDDDESIWRRRLVIHGACDDMAPRFMQTSRRAGIASMGDLWMVLDLRCIASPWYTKGPITGMIVPMIPTNPTRKRGEGKVPLGLTHYYAPPHFSQPKDGWWNTDPSEIPNITGSLFSNLEQTKSVCDVSTEFRRHMAKLPCEIQLMIVSLLLEDDVGLECNYLMPQSMWRELFFKIPFLWDLDRKAMDDLTVPTDVGGERWDWEGLSRKLLACPEPAREDENRGLDGKVRWVAWNYEHVGLQVPDALTNRRRIWEILTDMHPNDVGAPWDMEELPGDIPFADSDDERDEIWESYWSAQQDDEDDEDDEDNEGDEDNEDNEED